MRKTILFVVLVIGMIATTFGQLNANAEGLKKHLPHIYNPIKESAIEQWDSDHEMVVYVINNQSDAYRELGNILIDSNYNETILLKALELWTENISIKNSPTDYEMVVYEYKNQLEASKQY
jgi:hypothetical protein